MNTIAYLREHFDQSQSARQESGLGPIRKNAFNTFNSRGIPTSKQEDWKYTRIGVLFNKEYQFPVNPLTSSLVANDLKSLRLPGHD
jgi:Fe-S cluster assembly protein SufD